MLVFYREYNVRGDGATYTSDARSQTHGSDPGLQRKDWYYSGSHDSSSNADKLTVVGYISDVTM